MNHAGNRWDKGDGLKIKLEERIKFSGTFEQRGAGRAGTKVVHGRRVGPGYADEIGITEFRQTGKSKASDRNFRPTRAKTKSKASDRVVRPTRVVLHHDHGGTVNRIIFNRK